MVVIGTYSFKDLNAGKITPEEPFTDSYAEEIHELEQFRTSTKWLREILYTEYDKADLNEVMKNQCKHLT